jgi:hypothetical protein
MQSPEGLIGALGSISKIFHSGVLQEVSDLLHVHLSI